MVNLVDEQYLVVEFSDKFYPIIKICQQNTGIIVSYIGTKHHYSLHLANIVDHNIGFYLISQDKQIIKYPEGYIGNTPIVFTSFDLDKPEGVWDKQKVEVANYLKLNKAERRLKYYENRVLPLGSIKIFPLGGRSMYLTKTKRYDKNKCVICKINTHDLFIEVLFTRDKFSKKSVDVEIKTKIGNLGFNIFGSYNFQ